MVKPFGDNLKKDEKQVIMPIMPETKATRGRVANLKRKPKAKVGRKPNKSILQNQHKIFICHLIAQGVCVEGILERLKAEYNITLTATNVYVTYIHGRRWKRITRWMRKRMNRHINDLAIAHKAWRLNMIERMVLKAEKAGNFGLALELLDRAKAEIEGERPVNAKFQIGDNRTQVFQDTDVRTDESMEYGRLLNDTVNRISSYIKK